MGSGIFSLHFIRDKEKRAVDFLIANSGETFLLIEAKLSDSQPEKPLLAFQNRLGVPAVLLIGAGNGYRIMPNGTHKFLISPAWQWLAQLP
jgi:hypothetical protein